MIGLIMMIVSLALIVQLFVSTNNSDIACLPWIATLSGNLCTEIFHELIISYENIKADYVQSRY